MAVAAVRVAVDLVEGDTGDTVVELRGWEPVPVAGCAPRVEPVDSVPSVTRLAVEVGVVDGERPPGIGVREEIVGVATMAVLALLLVVTRRARVVEVDVLQAAHRVELATVLDMTTSAALLAVALGAVTLIALAVVSMVKRDRVAGSEIGREGDQLDELDRAIVTVVAERRGGATELPPLSLLMADAAGRVAVPLRMTAQTAAVIRALEAGLSEVLVGHLGRMTVLARRVWHVGRRVVMAGVAAGRHSSHAGVGAVVETNRDVELFQLAEHDHVRPQIRLERGRCVVARALSQTRLVRPRGFAAVTPRTLECVGIRCPASAGRQAEREEEHRPAPIHQFPQSSAILTRETRRSGRSCVVCSSAGRMGSTVTNTRYSSTRAAIRPTVTATSPRLGTYRWVA